jgi:predicted outer membrane protein
MTGTRAIKNIRKSAKGTEEYAQTARAAGKAPLEAVNAAVGEDFPKIDVAQELGKYGDYNGVRTALYDNLNKVLPPEINVQFRALTDEVDAAQMAAEEGGVKEVAVYANKQKELAALIDKAKLTPELQKAINAGWMRYDTLGKLTGSFDLALEGHIGAEGKNAAERGITGINGNRLTTAIDNAVIRYMRPVVAEALGGEEYLKSLEAIAQKTSTSKGMVAIMHGFWKRLLIVGGLLYAVDFGFSLFGFKRIPDKELFLGIVLIVFATTFDTLEDKLDAIDSKLDEILRNNGKPEDLE